MIKSMNNKIAEQVTPMQLNTLTLERNAVLVVRVSKDSGYDVADFKTIHQALKNAFPSHTVLIFYDDVEFMAIEDKGCLPERITVNDSSNYY